MLRDLNAFWSSLNLGNPERARNALLEYIPLLVARFGENAAAVAADWYDEARAAEAVPGRFRATMADSPYLDASEPLVRRAAGALFTDNPSEALAALSSKVPKYVLAASRATITTSADRDPRASGWQRVASGGACDFCRMLAGRGAVYKESSVHFASHGDCNCAAVPSWDPNAPEVDVGLYAASRRKTSAYAKEAPVSTSNAEKIRGLQGRLRSFELDPKRYAIDIANIRERIAALGG